MNYKTLLTYDFWFGIDRVMLRTYDRAFLVLAAALVVAAAGLFLWSRLANTRITKLLRLRMMNASITIGILLAVWVWLRSEAVNLFSMRIVLAAILVFGLVWAVRIFLYARGEYSRTLDAMAKKAQKDKYFQSKR